VNWGITVQVVSHLAWMNSLFLGTEYDTDEETDKLLHKPYEGEARVDLPADNRELAEQAMKNKAKEGEAELRKIILFYMDGITNPMACFQDCP